jgi:hypothetical protein
MGSYRLNRSGEALKRGRIGGRGFAAGLTVLVLVTVPGCGSDALSSPTAINLRKLANLYLNYAVSANGRGPSREEDFKKYVQGMPDFLLRNNNVEPAERDGLFVSGRDQQPIVIVYGVAISGMSATQAPLVAYEQSGQKGKRLVAFANTKVEEVDEARLKELKGPN